jgi:hypothetical protein
MSDGGQRTDGTQKSADICLSVRSVRKFTSKAHTPNAQHAPAGVVAERVKSETDQTYGQIYSQAPEKSATSNSENLSDLQTDQTGGRFRCEAIPADLTIPAFLDRRAEANRVCAQCGVGRPGDLPTVAVTDKDGATRYVHEQCWRFWKKEHGDAPAPGDGLNEGRS